MCGIAGAALAPNTPGTNAAEATRAMTDHMRLRGPDAEGSWFADGVALGHRRLSILDLQSRSNQPMLSASQRFAVVFNGEIYNFRELRNELEQQGTQFRTTSDTEVIVELFAREGTGMLSRLRGMFALAVWDTVSRELLLARDPYGIKPLYYSQTSDGLIFASQVKALLASGLIEPAEESAGVAGFYLWGSVPDPWTLYRGVFALPAGHFLKVRDGVAGEATCWSDIGECWRGPARMGRRRDLELRVRDAVRQSVVAHLVSDVPVCVFLSGGIDSAVVAGVATESGASVEGITLAFEEFAGTPDDETDAARLVAKHYRIPHFVRRVSRAEFDADLQNIIEAMDQPSVDGVNTWFASKAAAERGYKVALSGVGGDELFCGYSSFPRVRRAAALSRTLSLLPGARALLREPCAVMARRLRRPKLAGFPRLTGSLEDAYFLNRGLFLVEELPFLMGPDRARLGLSRLGEFPAGLTPAGARDATAAVGLLESERYLRNQLLRDSDWASMAHSLELRTPLVDSWLLRELGPSVADFSNGMGKVALARSTSLPPLITTRVKTGFSVPMGAWLPQSLQGRGRLVPSALEASWARRWARTLLAEALSCA
jgi:asparagine synthase (glutamine-hydrolysing)